MILVLSYMVARLDAVKVQLYICCLELEWSSACPVICDSVILDFLCVFVLKQF